MNPTFRSNLEMILYITMMIVAAAYIYVTFIDKENHEERAKKYSFYFIFVVIIFRIIQELLKK